MYVNKNRVEKKSRVRGRGDVYARVRGGRWRQGGRRGRLPCFYRRRTRKKHRPGEQVGGGDQSIVASGGCNRARDRRRTGRDGRGENISIGAPRGPLPAARRTTAKRPIDGRKETAGRPRAFLRRPLFHVIEQRFKVHATKRYLPLCIIPPEHIMTLFREERLQSCGATGPWTTTGRHLSTPVCGWGLIRRRSNCSELKFRTYINRVMKRVRGRENRAAHCLGPTSAWT